MFTSMLTNEQQREMLFNLTGIEQHKEKQKSQQSKIFFTMSGSYFLGIFEPDKYAVWNDCLFCSVSKKKLLESTIYKTLSLAEVYTGCQDIASFSNTKASFHGE